MCECGESEEAGRQEAISLRGKVLKVVRCVSLVMIICLCDVAASSAGEQSRQQQLLLHVKPSR